MKSTSLILAVIIVTACGVDNGDDQADVSNGGGNTVVHEDFPADGGPAADAGQCNPHIELCTDGPVQSPDAGQVPAADAGPAPAADAGTSAPAQDAGQPADETTGGCGGELMPDPLLVEDPFSLGFSTAYIGDECGLVFGDVPNQLEWNVGAFVTDGDFFGEADGYMWISFASIAAGTWSISYGTRGCMNDPTNPLLWAEYGRPEFLELMTPSARRYIHCGWWDAATQTDLRNAASCGLRITVDSAGNISPAGNMENFN